jgi:AraC family transcriptional regulator, positive regulator of tynA and feaB
MAETVFKFDRRNFQDCQNTFRGADNREYYGGEYSIEAGTVIDVRAERRVVGSCSIIRLRSRTRLLFRRSWSHIREDGTDVIVLWFVKRGRLSVTHQCGCADAQAGDFLITQSTSPFFMECTTDPSGWLEALHVVVPTHVLNRVLAREVRAGFCMSARGRGLPIAERILTDLLEDPGEVSEPTAAMLIESALKVLGEAAGERLDSDPAGRRSTIAGTRLQEVLRFIEAHLSDPRLNMRMVAQSCGISARYVSALLKQHGVAYSTTVWSKRLEMASRLLAQSKPGDSSIASIAYRVGFKSPAHFSRMFRRTYHMSPLDYRGAAIQ